MKKKTIIIIIAAVVLVSALIFSFVFFAGKQITVARCVVNENGTLYMVYDERPVVLNYTKDTDYKTGDKLLIIHSNAFAESYPEQTRASFIMKIGSGTAADIPQKVFDVLIETGNW